MDTTNKILFAPLQGLTDHYFRNAYQKYFGNVDQYYAPWIRLDGAGQIKNTQKKDLDPSNNHQITLIPQLMCNKTEDFLSLSTYISSLGYNAINWNLGCPHPMITNRGMGSALLKEPDQIISVLESALPKIKLEVSLKMRLGFKSEDEIYGLLERLNKFPLKEIIIHARTADQMYKGNTKLNAFENCLSYSRHQLVYNGDITSYQSYKALNERFPQIKNWMIGRGLIANPFLAGMIKNGSSQFPDKHREIFLGFHHELLEKFLIDLSGEKHVLMKMLSYWQYFSLLFKDSQKSLKRVKKAKTLSTYKEAVQINLSNGFKSEANLL